MTPSAAVAKFLVRVIDAALATPPVDPGEISGLRTLMRSGYWPRLAGQGGSSCQRGRAGAGEAVKACRGCQALKPAAEFHRSHTKSGLRNFCKDCENAKKREKWATSDRAAHAAKKRVYSAQDHVRAANRARHKVYYDAFRATRIEANLAVRRAIRDGALVPQLCLMCGEKADAHHPDYSRPLDVVWLCRMHHRQAHTLIREAA